jgi:glycosyltransferase involved in cell wall biosynthesis
MSPEGRESPLTEPRRGRPERYTCIITPYLPSTSETFIRAHAQRLPGRVVLIHGWPPSIGEQPLLSRTGRAMRKLFELAAGGESPTTAAYVKAFRRYRPCAVLAEYGTTGVLVLPACRRAGIPLIVHFHGLDASVRTVLQENAETYPAMFKEAAAVISVSRAMHERLIALGAPRDRLHYNPCGVDCREFSGATPATAPPVFLAVGRFVDKKAPHLTLRAFALVHRLLPAAALRMVGDGPLLDGCRHLASELGVDGAVTFLGAQPHSVVREEMRGARCFVQHSVEAPSGDCEGTPVGILEAGASGLPVVSTRHAGIPDVVVERETGFLVAEGDVDAMADRMICLAKDPDLARRLGLAARERIEHSFSIERSIDQLSKIIESCVAGSRCGHE